MEKCKIWFLYTRPLKIFFFKTTQQNSQIKFVFGQHIKMKLTTRAWHLCSCLDTFYQEASYIKLILTSNGYPQNFTQSLISKFIKPKFAHKQKDTVYGPEKKPIYLYLPYCGAKSLKTGRQLQLIYTKVAPWTRLILSFKPIYKLNTLSKLKSKYKLLCNSNVVYKINCANCDEFYIGMTQRILQKRINEHSSCETSSVYRHAQLTNHDINFASPSILAHDIDNVKLRLQIKETLLIKDESAFNSLNKNIGSFPLTLW